MGSKFQVDEISISNPYARIRQYEDGSINLQDIVKESPADTTTESEVFLFQVDRFALEGGALEGRFSSLGQDSLIAIRDLNIEAAGSYMEEGYSVQLQELAFRVSDTRLPPIDIQSTAQATDQKITLEKLVIGTGRSVLQSSATVNTNDSTGSVSFSAQPLSWRDVAAYVEPVPVQQNLQLELSLSGSPSLFNVGLRAQADGLQKLNLDTQFEWNNTVFLKRAELDIAQMDLEVLTSDSTYPSIREMQLLAKGNVDVLQPQHAQMNGSFSVNRLAQGSYRVDQLTGNFTLAKDELQTNMQVTRQGESLNAELLASRIWSSSPNLLHP
ncbi:MAG: hypothetical protein U5K69_01415 [Balneolaceae bacterium]|nr:hypothetical protein [Balneolaceae bacterium]